MTLKNYQLLIVLGFGFLINGLSMLEWNITLLGRIGDFPHASKEMVVIGDFSLGVILILLGILAKYKRRRKNEPIRYGV